MHVESISVVAFSASFTTRALLANVGNRKRSWSWIKRRGTFVTIFDPRPTLKGEGVSVPKRPNIDWTIFLRNDD